MPLTDSKYATLVSKVISDFDSIFREMASKKVDNGGVQLNTYFGQASNIATENYATLIKNQLFRVGVPTKEGENVSYTFSSEGPTLDEGVIHDYRTLTGEASVKTLDNAKGVVTFTIPAAGYYDTSSKIKASFDTEVKTIDGATSLGDPLEGYYVISASEGKILGSVKLAKGSVGLRADGNYTITTTGSTGTGDKSLTTTTTIDAASTVTTSSEIITGGYTIVVDNALKYDAKITATPNVEVSAGWITRNDVTIGEASTTLTDTGTSKSTFYVAKGSVAASLSGDPSITLTPEAGLVLTDKATVGTNTADYYKIDTATSDLNVVGTVTEGYVKPEAAGAKTNLGTVDALTTETYIKKGSVENGSIAISDNLTLASGSIAHTTKAATDYEITLNVDDSTAYEGRVNAGYIPSTAGTYNVGVTGTKSVYVSKGAVAANAQLSTTTTDASGLINSTGEYQVVISPTIDFTKAVITPGYLPADSNIVGTTVANDITLKFAKAALSYTVAKPETHLVDREGDGSGASKDEELKAVEIFTTTAPATGDYYEINVPAPTRTSLVAGFVKDGSEITIGASDSIFLPKAKVQYITTETGETYLDVTTGGYLPSGSIKDITTVDMPAATVTASLLDGAAGILVSNPADKSGYYEITVGKGTVTSGYISATKGTVSGTGYIAKGSISVANSQKSFAQTEVNETAEVLAISAATVKKDKTGFKVGLKGIATTAVSQTAGYVKDSDISVNGGDKGTLTNDVEFDNTISLPAAQYGLNDKSTSLTVAATPSAGIDSKTASDTGYDKYSVSTTVSGSVEIKATGSGWLSTEDAGKEVAITGGTNSGNVYLKTGTGPTSADWSAESKALSKGAISDNFATNVDGAYTVSINGTVGANATLGTGYYGTAESAISGTAKVVDSYSVAHGGASIAASATLKTTKSTDLVTSATGAEATHVYVNVGVDTFTTETTVTEGYIKRTDVTEASTVTAEAQRVWIKKYSGTLSTTDLTKAKDYSGTEFNGKVFQGITLGSKTGNVDEASSVALKADTATTVGLRDTAYIDVSAKYSTNNIEVKLTPDAMGSSVADELSKLEKRLTGQLTITAA